MGGKLVTERFFLIAGELSGDALGAALMDGLAAETDASFIGVGGPLMTARGLTSQFPMEELSVMGIVEILPKLFRLLRRVRETAEAVLASDAKALVMIDSPDFCLRVAKAVKAVRPDFPVIHYVAPSVWAWRPERAQKMAQYVDHVLALLPFEPPYMQEAGMSCDFVGHPVVAQPLPTPDDVRAFREEFDIHDRQKLLVVLPGSRSGEVTRLSPIFREVADRLRDHIPNLAVVVPAVHTQVAALEQAFEGANYTIIDPRDYPADEADLHKRAAFLAADVALAASGTVSLELAAAETPMVIGYKMNWLTTQIIKRKVKLETVTLVNLVTNTLTVPEFLLEDCTADNIYPELHRLLTVPGAEDEQLQAEADTMRLLGQGDAAPGLRAAKSVLNFLSR